MTEETEDTMKVLNSIAKALSGPKPIQWTIEVKQRYCHNTIRIIRDGDMFNDLRGFEFIEWLVGEFPTLVTRLAEPHGQTLN